MDILHKIETDFKEAYRNKDKEKALVLSLLRSAFQNMEISQKREKLSEEQVLEVIKREIKQRKEALESWQKANRPEEILREKRALKILEQYLPQQYSQEEVKKIAQEVIAAVNASSVRDFGKVMGALMLKLKGRTDGAVASKIVQELLNT